MPIKNQMVGGGKSEDRRPNDFYPTPPSMVKQLLEREQFEGNILEPCAGDGAIGRIIRKTYKNVFMYDIMPKSKDVIQRDFLVYSDSLKYDNIITNFPYDGHIDFILKGFEVCTKKMALLFPLAYLHGIERFNKIYSELLLKTIYVFVRRPALDQPLDDNGKYLTGMQTYAWYVFDKDYFGFPSLQWIDNNDYVINKKRTEKTDDQISMEFE
jgi:hypothetical protein